MQFKLIGEVISLIGKDGSNNIKSVAKALEGLDKSATFSILSLTKLSEKEKIAVAAMNGIDVADDIADIGDAATKSTSKIDNLGTALVGAFKSHPYLIAGTAIAAIGATAYTVYKNIKQGYIESATEATSVWEESKTSLEDYASKYKELKSQLDSGNLSEAETISVKQQILDIQNQITSAYGESAAGIDLINGKLDTQLAKMQSISQEEAQRNINQNRENYEDA